MTTTNTVFAAEDGVTVTIKYGKGYEETWAVFKGSVQAIRNMVTEYFGIDPSVIEEQTTHELVLNMTSVAQGTGNAAALLGAVAIPASQSNPAPQSTGGNPWAGLGDEQPQGLPEHPFQSVLDAIAGAVDVPALQKVWATNQSAFSNDTVTTAYKARGKELSK